LGRQDVTASLRKFSLARWSEEVRGRLGFRRSYGGGFGGYGGRGGAQTVVWGLVGVNLVVFGLWQTVDRRFMMENFMVSVDAVMRGRLHTIVTSAFSQARFDHLAMNMLGLYFFGSEIAQLFGGRWLLNLYLAGGIAGSDTLA
jgi:membrane associated rhomboid family serine protease